MCVVILFQWAVSLARSPSRRFGTNAKGQSSAQMPHAKDAGPNIAGEGMEGVIE